MILHVLPLKYKKTGWAMADPAHFLATALVTEFWNACPSSFMLGFFALDWVIWLDKTAIYFFENI